MFLDFETNWSFEEKVIVKFDKIKIWLVFDVGSSAKLSNWRRRRI